MAIIKKSDLFRLVAVIMVFLLISNTSAQFEYTYTGELTENGNGEWDDGEWTIFTFAVDGNSTFDADLYTGAEVRLRLYLGDFKSFKDINEVLGGNEDRLRASAETTNGYASISYSLSDEKEIDLAVLSISDSNPESITIEIYTNSPMLETGSSFSINWGAVLIVIAVIVVLVIIFFLFRFIRSRGGDEYYDDDEYDDDYEYVIDCPKCGAENDYEATFCDDCGTKLD